MAIALVVVQDDPAQNAAATVAAAGDEASEVIVSRCWPGVAPDTPVAGRASTLDVATNGGAAAANAALGLVEADVVVLLGAGDIPAAGAVAELARVATAGTAASGRLRRPGHVDAVADSWVGSRPAGAALEGGRFAAVSREQLLVAGGLDERLRDLDVAVIDLLARLEPAVVPRPDIVAEGWAGEDPRRKARDAGRAAQALTALAGEERVSGSGSRWAAPLLRGERARVRAAFARGRGRPPLLTGPSGRGGPGPRPPRAEQRPAVAVVVPFAGSPHGAEGLLDVLDRVERGPGDELVVVDNSRAAVVPERSGITVVRAAEQSSSYYARNRGVAATTAPWILFSDADCIPAPWILDAYFAPPPDARCGVVVGDLLDPLDATNRVGRYSEAVSIMSQSRLLEHPYMPFGVTANLLVRRDALEQAGGFAEGIRSGGDADLCWRLQEAGWTLEHRPRAAVVHEHRASLRALMRQYARYGGGTPWLSERHPEVEHGWLGVGPRRLLDPAAAVAAGRFEHAGTQLLDFACAVAARYGARRGNSPRR